MLEMQRHATGCNVVQQKTRMRKTNPLAIVAGCGGGSMTVRGSIIDAIGSTPLIELSRICRGPGRIFAKAEFLNPGGSMKDRAALQIVCDAEADGRLAAGQTVV